MNVAQVTHVAAREEENASPVDANAVHRHTAEPKKFVRRSKGQRNVIEEVL